MTKSLAMQVLPLPSVLRDAAQLPRSGRLEQSAENYFYLNIDDRYIHDLYPHFAFDKQIIKPDYFNKYTMGAHITVVYPEEKTYLSQAELDKEHTFDILGVYRGIIPPKEYYVLLIESPSLRQLRQQYQLPALLSFKQHKIGLHITIGVKPLNNE